MDFFAHQDRARKATRWLLFLYALAVILVVVAINAVILPFVINYDEPIDFFALAVPVSLVTLITLLIVCGGSAVRISELAFSGGAGVAQAMGGRLVEPNTSDLQERQLLNVVEEMALAAGIPVPQVFVLDQEKSINAFAAGWSPETAAIGVTRGALDNFTRDQLQGVIAHEFSHVLNGDMSLNLRLIGFLFGLELIFILAVFVLRFYFYAPVHVDRSGDDDEGKSGMARLVILLVCLAIAAIGFIGKLIADLIRAAISRQREFLADASAVQFTRNPDGIGQALMKIGVINKDIPVQSNDAAAASHLFFSEITVASAFSSVWASHPPLNERIKRILPDYTGTATAQIEREIQNPPGLRYQEYKEPETSGSKRKSKADEWRDRLGHNSFLDSSEGPVTNSAVAGLAGSGGVSSPAEQVIIPRESQSDFDDESFRRRLHAEETLAQLDPRLTAEIRDPFGAQAVLCAALLDVNPEILAKQQTILSKRLPHKLIQMIQGLRLTMASCSPVEKMFLTELSVPSLRLLSQGQYETLRQTLELLTEADGRLDLFEMALRLVLTNRLDEFFNLKSRTKTKSLSREQTKETLETALGFLAYEGHASEEQACQAFDAACSQTGLQLFIPDRAQCRLLQFAKAIQRLGGLNRQTRETLLNAVRRCAEFDGQITPREQELLFAFKAILGV